MSKIYDNIFSTNAMLLLLAAGLFFLGIGCKSSHKATKAIIKEERKPEDKSAPDLQFLITENSFKAGTLTAKASVKSLFGDQNNSFNISLRMHTDSVIWISISPLLGIEVARVMITRDSVKYLDRLNNRYALSDFEYLNNLLKTHVDFDIIQGVLTGNLFAYKKNKFNSVYLEDRYYILSTLSKRKLKRSLEEEDINKPIVHDMWVDGTTYRITRLIIQDQRARKSLQTDYTDHRQTEGGLFPFQSNTAIVAEQNASISIDYSKITINADVEFPFTIPPSYEKIH